MTTTTNDQGTTNSGAGAANMANQYVEKARGFAKARPAATAALVGVVGLAILNTLRGK